MCAVEALAGVGLIVVYIIGMLGHQESSLFVSISSLLLLILFTAALAVMSVQWWRGETWRER